MASVVAIAGARILVTSIRTGLCLGSASGYGGETRVIQITNRDFFKSKPFLHRGHSIREVVVLASWPDPAACPFITRYNLVSNKIQLVA